VPALLLLSALAWPSKSTAQSAEPIQLTWDAPAECPDSEAVLARVRQILGASSSVAAPLQAEATIAQQGDRQFRMRLVIRAGTLLGARSIEAKSCNDLVGAAAVALAVAVSSMTPIDDKPSEAEPSPGAVPDGPGPRVVPQARPAAATAPTSREDAQSEAPVRRWHGLLRLPLASLAAGPTSEPSRGLGLGAGASFDQWRLLAEAKLWQSRHVTRRELLDDYGAELSRFTITLRGCRSFGGRRFEVAPCALLSLQHLSARGTGPHIAPRNPDVAWVATGVGVQARLLLTPWVGLIMAADGEIQLARPQIELEGVGSLGRLAPAAATITVGSEWIL
jgi:hypothetical protein